MNFTDQQSVAIATAAAQRAGATHEKADWIGLTVTAEHLESQIAPLRASLQFAEGRTYHREKEQLHGLERRINQLRQRANQLRENAG